MLSPDSQAAFAGALELARKDGCVAWGFIYWVKEGPDGAEDEYGFDAYDNHQFTERDLLRMTQMAMKFIRKSRKTITLPDPEDKLFGGVN